MKILVAGAFEAGSHWAHAINTTKMAEGFARSGHEVDLVCRRPESGVQSDATLTEAYGLRGKLRWVQLRRRWLGRIGGPHAAFASQALPSLLRARPGLVYARNYTLPAWAAGLGFPTVVESHAHPGNEDPAYLRVVAAAQRPAVRGWVTISEVLARAHAEAGVPREKIRVLPDAVDLDLFTPPERLPPSPYKGERPVAAYAGHLYDYKGIPTVLGAARALPSVDFHLIGGWPEDIARTQAAAREQGLGNVTVHGLKPHGEVPAWLWHAQALLLPPSADHASAKWTSPVKLGEYLASGTPVVATSIPALQDWLVEDEVAWVPPDDADGLARGIEQVLKGGVEVESRLLRARRRAESWSYEVRARRVLEQIS